MKQDQVPEEVSLKGLTPVYMGEGNANLVVAIKEKGIVIRFPKSKFNDKCQDTKLRNICKFFNHVMRPLLGPAFITPVSIVAVSPRQDFEKLREKLCVERPEGRCCKDIYYPMGILMPDFTSPLAQFASGIGPTLTVELKPKTGYLLPTNCPHPLLCNFCLKQFYKMEQGTIKRISDYCPLDLFSGNLHRMMRAVKGLLDCPQNNLRILGSGNCLHDQNTTRSSSCAKFVEDMLGEYNNLAHLLVRALTAEYEPHILKDSHQHTPDSLNTLETTPTSGVKEPDCDIVITKGGPEQQVDGPMTANGERCCYTQPRHGGGQEGLGDDKAGLRAGSVLRAVHTIQSRNQLSDKQALELLNQLTNRGYEVQDLEDLVIESYNDGDSFKCDKLRKLRHYQLYATARDLSIFISFRRVGPKTAKALPCLQLNGQSYLFSVNLIDLDPKQLHRISKYVGEKEKWMRAWAKFKKSRCENETDTPSLN